MSSIIFYCTDWDLLFLAQTIGVEIGDETIRFDWFLEHAV